MNDEIYEVGRDEYAGLVREMKTDCFDMEKAYEDDCVVIKLVSKRTGQVITKRVIDADQNETYYIYELPANDERLAPKKIRQYQLESKEEVQAFFDILNKIQKGEKHD